VNGRWLAFGKDPTPNQKSPDDRRIPRAEAQEPFYANLNPLDLVGSSLNKPPSGKPGGGSVSKKGSRVSDVFGTQHSWAGVSRYLTAVIGADAAYKTARN